MNSQVDSIEGDARDLGVSAPRVCPVCGIEGPAAETALIRSNVRRFRERRFGVWRCVGCQSLHCERIADISEYYKDYPIRQQELNYFSRAWYRIVLDRLKSAGLQKNHRILDFGCNQGLFIRFMHENGYSHCTGYDPYVSAFSSRAALDAQYDWIICLDVIEHDDDPVGFLIKLKKLLAPAGKICLETPNAAGIDLKKAEEFLHSLHMPFHLHILSEQALRKVAEGQHLRPESVFTRWYMDAPAPGTARLLFESLLLLGDNDIDSGYEPPRLSLFFRHPQLFIYLLFGYFIPQHKTDHMMMILAA